MYMIAFIVAKDRHCFKNIILVWNPDEWAEQPPIFFMHLHPYIFLHHPKRMHAFVDDSKHEFNILQLCRNDTVTQIPHI